MTRPRAEDDSRQSSDWLPDDAWQLIQRSVPIACVDVLPLQFAPDGRPSRFGLILRDTPDAGRQWCLIGGRIRYGEAIEEALARHVRSSLGHAVTALTTSGDQPLVVVQYGPQDRPDFLPDARQHAVALTFAAGMRGVPRATGDEALEFRWYAASDLDAIAIGFGQRHVVREVLSRAAPSRPSR